MSSPVTRLMGRYIRSNTDLPVSDIPIDITSKLYTASEPAPAQPAQSDPVVYRPRGAAISSAPKASEIPTGIMSKFDLKLYPSLDNGSYAPLPLQSSDSFSLPSSRPLPPRPPADQLPPPSPANQLTRGKKRKINSRVEPGRTGTSLFTKGGKRQSRRKFRRKFRRQSRRTRLHKRKTRRH